MRLEVDMAMEVIEYKLKQALQCQQDQPLANAHDITLSNILNREKKVPESITTREEMTAEDFLTKLSKVMLKDKFVIT